MTKDWLSALARLPRRIELAWIRFRLGSDTPAYEAAAASLKSSLSLLGEGDHSAQPNGGGAARPARSPSFQPHSPSE